MSRKGLEKGIPSLFLKKFNAYLILLSIHMSHVLSVKIDDSYMSALLAIKTELDPSNAVLMSWQPSNDCNDWLGLVCDTSSGRVTKINLESQNLTGTISERISDLYSLQELSLSNNDLSGTLPLGIRALENLEILTVSPTFGHKGLSGNIPDVFQLLTKLKKLNFQNNQLEGRIPDSFGKLRSLEILSLEHNYMTSLNENMKYMTNLKQLLLGENLFTGPLPSYIGELTNLEELSLFQNLFEGEIPDSFANLTKLQTLIMDGNKLNGSIPFFFSNMENISFLALGSNNLSGNIPFDFGRLTNLQILSIQSNALSGPIPSSLGNCKDLVVLNLGYNSLSGVLPSSFGDLINLETLIVSNNLLTGSLPQSIGNLSKLNILRLQYNKFNASIPKTFGNLTNLNEVILAHNNFDGNIPSAFSNLSNLQILDLSYNPFYGEFGANLSLKTIKILYIKNCNFRQISISESKFKNLIFLDASENIINGKLNFSFPKSLQTLKLKKNKISGEFLVTKYYSALSVLILDENDFGGTVPSLEPTFPNLTFLSCTKNKFSRIDSISLFKNPQNISILLHGNPLCQNSSISLNLSSACSSLPYTLLSRFPYNNISNSEIQNNLNLVSKPLLCSNVCSEPETYSPFAYEQTKTCVCNEPFQITILLLSPPFEIFTQERKHGLEASIADELILESQSMVKIDSIVSNKRGKVMTILLFSPDWNVPSYPLNLARFQEIKFKFRHFSSVDLVGPYELLASSLKYLMKNEILRQSNKTKSVDASFNSKKKNKFQIWILVTIVSTVIFFLLLSIILFSLYWKKHKSKQSVRAKHESNSASIFKEWEIESGNKEWQELSGVKFIPLAVIHATTGNFSEAHLIGSGGYGQVYRGQALTGDQWAIKRSKVVSEQALKNFHTEVNAISKMNHRNLVQLLGYCDEDGEQILVYEYIPNGTLKKNLKGRGRVLSVVERVEIGFGLAQALSYLHSFAKQTIVHRDIKSDNILLDENYEAKLADFGLLKHLPHGDSSDAMSTRIAGTPGYLDPEYYKTFKVTPSSDVYSFGVVLLELVTGKPPVLDNMTPVDESYIMTVGKWALPYIKKAEINEIIDPKLTLEVEKEEKLLGAIESMAKLAYKCMQKQGKDRPKMDEVSWELREIRASITSLTKREDITSLKEVGIQDAENSDVEKIVQEEVNTRVDREFYENEGLFLSYETSKKSNTKSLNNSFDSRFSK